MEDALKRLDKLTQEEARMATAEALRATHTVDERVMVVDDKLTGAAKDVQVIKRESSTNYIDTELRVSRLCREPAVGEPSQMALPTRPIH